tara:strand:- start:2047 stop:2508 length:462 start_codon:yes stop_codon:yes gene_type:complete
MNLQALKNKIKELEKEVERLEQPEVIWGPKGGQKYWWVDSLGRERDTVIAIYHPDDSLCIAHHNVYQTKALVKKASILQRRANLIIQACLNFDPDFEPDWEAWTQVKYGFYYNHNKCAWNWSDTITLNDCAAHVSTAEIADKVMAYLNSQEIK